jgi:hypothetical protein
MRITSGGNVGIGTTSPNGRLTIVGDGSQNGFSGVLRVSDTSTIGKWAGIGLPDAQGTTTAANNYYLIGRGGAYTDRILSLHLPNATDYGSGAQPKLGIYSTGSDLLFSVEASTGTSYFKGNVGIGTAGPSSLLTVHGANPFVRINNTSTSDHGIKITYGSSETHGLHLLYQPGSALSFIDNTYPTSSGQVFGDIYFRQNVAGTMTTRMTIKADGGGNVGIGTTSPGTKLAVNGVSSFGPSSKLSMIGLDINSDGTPTYIKIVTTIPVASPAADFTVNIKGFVYGAVRNADISISWHYYLSTFYNPIAKSSGGWAPTIRLSAENGFVAIVLSSPGYWPKFYVESMYSSAYTNQYASGWSWTDANATGNPIVNVPYASNFGNSFVMITDGNVGIGSTAPTQKLEVAGLSMAGAGSYRTSIYGDNGGAYLYFGTTANPSVLATIGTYGSLLNIDNSNGAISFKIVGSEKVRIDTNGNLGVGTTSPVSLLQVGGSSGATATPTAITFDNTYRNAVGGNTSLKIYLYRSGGETYGFGLNNAAGIEYHAGSSGGSSANHAFYTETTEKVRINSAGNVGIGTTTPAALLNIRASAPTGTGTVPTGTNLLIDSNTSNYLTFRNTADNSTYAGIIFLDNNVGAYISFRNYTGDVLNGSDSLIYGTLQDHIFQNGYVNETLYNRTETMRIKANGNVGIGTNNPTAKLHIAQGNSGGVAAILLSTDESTIQGPSANTQIRMGSNLVLNASNVMPFNVNGSETMRIITNGNVGIGTSSPGYKLQVNGTALATTVTDGSISLNGGDLLFAADGGGNGFQFDYYNTKMYIGNNAGSTWYMGIQDDGNVGIGTTSPSGKLHVIGEAITFKNGSDSQTTHFYIANAANTRAYNLQLNSAGTNLALWGYNSSNAWQNLVNFNYNGNVGIGTTSPSASLQVNSTTAGATLLRTDGTNGTLFSVVDDLSDSLMSVNNSAGLPVLEVFADDRIVAGQYGQNDFVVRNNRVGIGTNNPLAELHVTASTSIPAAVFIGDVGIGTTSPTAQSNYRFLQVNAPTSAVIEAVVGGTRIGGFDSTSNILYVGSIGSFPVVFRTAVTERMRLDTNGNLGIGTSTPTAKVDTLGVRIGRDFSITNRATVRLDSNGTSLPSDILFGHTSAANETSWNGVYWSLSSRAATDGNKFYFYRGSGNPSNASEAVIMTFDPGLNVGIGSTSPTQKLDVAGSIYTSGKLVQRSATQSLSGTTGCTIDLANGVVHILSLSSGTTISSFTYNSRDNNPSVNTLMLVFKYAGTASVTFTNVIWANGVTPTLTGTNGYADVFMLTSYQGGAGTPVWIGTVVAQALVSTNL